MPRRDRIHSRIHRDTRRISADLIVRAAEAGLIVPIAAIVLCLGFIWGLAEVADEVIEGESATFDEWTLLLLREPGSPSDAIGPPWLQQLALEFTTLGGVTVLTMVILIGVSYLVARGRRHYPAAIALAIGAVAGITISTLLKSLFGRARPTIVPHLTEVTSLSFPSGHAMMSAIIWLTVGAMLAQAHGRIRLRIYFVALAAFMTISIGLTRIYLGVHYPTDVLAGWAAGAAWASLWWGVITWWRHRQRRTLVARGDPQLLLSDEVAAH